MVTVEIEDKDLEELIFTGKNHKFKKLSKDKRFMQALLHVYNTLRSAESIAQYSEYSFLHYEKLKNNLYISSVRIMSGRVERLLFTEHDNGIRIAIIELNETHYGNKK
jgi:hypothetical protein